MFQQPQTRHSSQHKPQKPQRLALRLLLAHQEPMPALIIILSPAAPQCLVHLSVPGKQGSCASNSEGYETYEELLDILEDTSLSITLRPLSADEANILIPETQTSAISPEVPATIQGQLRLQVEAETWLEVYQSTERGEGEQLYYGTAQTGETLSYTLPVYIHVGNAAGVHITENGRDVGLMGSSGEVTGRSFGQPLPVTEEPVTQDSVAEDPDNQTTDETTPNENTTNETPTEPQTTDK